MLSVWCPSGYKVFPKYTDAYWSLSKHHHGTAGSRRWYYMHSIFVKHCQTLSYLSNIRKRATSGCGVRAYVNIFQNGQCSVTPNYTCDMLLSMDCPEELHRKIKVTHKFMYHMVSRTAAGGAYSTKWAVR